MARNEHATVDREAVRTQLERVTDPELDRSIVELDYVDELRVGPEVFVQFKLPTAWCSPAFAWMMASDIREEVSTIPGVETVTVRLVEHMHEDEITRGVNEGRPFEAVFEDATEGIEAVRATLDGKARLARQYHAVEALLDAGVSPRQIVELTRRDIALEETTDRAVVSLADGALMVYAPFEPLATYLEQARETGVVSGPSDRLFVTPEGEQIAPEEFEHVHHRTRLTKTNVSGQGAICDALHGARYDDVERHSGGFD